jgi:crossover junction endodeoxyribonuclease RuvC
VIVLGVDPSTVGTGWAVLEGDSRHARPRAYGVIRPPRGGTLPEQLRAIHAGLSSLLEEHAPDILVAESPFVYRNVRTALVLGQVRGVVMLAAAQHGVPCGEYSASEIKRAAVGHGGAGKGQVARMMARILGLEEVPCSDAADALATAWCHLSRARIPAPAPAPIPEGRT